MSNKSLAWTSLLAFGLGLLGSSSALAATEFTGDLIPGAMVREVYGNALYFRTLPEDFPRVELPQGLDLKMGITLKQGSSQRLVILNNGSDAAADMLIDAYVAAGWHNFTDPLNNGSYTGTASLCHNELGSMNVYKKNGSNSQKIIRVTYNNTPPSESCERQQVFIDAGLPNGALTYIQTQTPILPLPENADTTGLGSIRLFSSSSFSTILNVPRYELKSERKYRAADSTPAMQAEHFAEQLAAEGWQQDNSISSARSALSSWSKSITYPEVTGWELSGQSVTLDAVLSLFVNGDRYELTFLMHTRED